MSPTRVSCERCRIVYHRRRKDEVGYGPCSKCGGKLTVRNLNDERFKARAIEELRGSPK